MPDPIRLRMDSVNFRALIRGEVVKLETPIDLGVTQKYEIILTDIGWDVMRDHLDQAIDDAIKTELEDVPKDV